MSTTSVLEEACKRKNTFPIDTNKPIWWVCTNNKKHRYKCSLSERQRRREVISSNNGCPRCVFYGEEMVLYTLKKNGHTVQREVQFTWCPYYYYDFYIPDLNIIIEVDGVQHFKRTRYGSHLSIAKRDAYKMKCAIQHGVSVLRIYQPDVIKMSFDWSSHLMSFLRKHEDSCIAFVASDEDVYNYHINLVRSW